tara:strand:+ start:221 stop:454 length:234 start_codon:yes stop_codon:yes gene_type:complete
MIEQLTKDFINKIVIEMKKDDNKKKIKDEILEPVFSEFSDKIYPYISILFLMYSINLILIIVILFLMLLRRKSNIDN